MHIVRPSPDDPSCAVAMADPEKPVEAAMALSVLLGRLACLPGPTVSVGDIVGHFGARAIGALLFIFALPNLLPLPPGSTTILGFPLLIFAPQLAVGARTAWLPRRLLARQFKASWIRDLSARGAPWLERAEALTTRRAAFMFGPAGTALIGLICTLLAIVLILPIPLGNMLPAAAIAVFGLSLVQRDGVLALAGYGLAAASAGALVLAAQLILIMLTRAGAWLETLAS